MAATLFSPLSVQAVGSDVSAEAEILNAHGIMLGSGGDLRLQDDFTVEQLLTVLARLQGKDAEAKAYPTTNNFKDVPASRWSAPYTAWAKATGLSQGKPDGTIGFDEKVTAQRLAAFLLRAMGYTDVPYADTMSRAAELGFVSATQDGGESLLRGPVAKIVYDATQVIGKDYCTLAEKLGISDKTPEYIEKRNAIAIVDNAVYATTSHGNYQTYSNPDIFENYSYYLVLGIQEPMTPADFYDKYHAWTNHAQSWETNKSIYLAGGPGETQDQGLFLLDENKDVKAIQIFKPDRQSSQSMKTFKLYFDNGSIGGIAYEDFGKTFWDNLINVRVLLDKTLISTVPIKSVCGGLGGPPPSSTEQWVSLNFYTYSGRLEYELIVGTEIIPVR
jgi:hypothetical protein